ncbi:MAG: serine/threonine-protein kinase, partial [Actinomycetota bacterium]
MSAPRAPQAGDVLGGCRLEREAASGGMGVVWEATQIALGRRVAVKVIAPALAGDPEFRERFVREARLTASVHHPNIVDVYDAGEQDGVLYIVMRFVDGVDLRTVLREQAPLDPQRAVRICEQVAGALDAAHRAGLIHRDVTPSNILLSAGGADEQAALTDFGLVKHLDTEGHTKTGAVGHDFYEGERQGAKGFPRFTDPTRTALGSWSG